MRRLLTAHSSCRFALGWLGLTCSLAAAARAGDETKPTAPPPSAEVQAMTLVREHLPELLAVLEPLKATNAAEYRKAIADLAAEVRTLADLRARNPARADLELEAWQARTRVELIAARLAAEASPERQSQLHAAIEARVDVEIRRQRFEADQAEAAVARVREHLAKVEANRDRARDALAKSEKNRAAKVENRYRALLPKPRPRPTATKPKPPGDASATPTPLPATSLNAVPMPPSRSPVEGVA